MTSPLHCKGATSCFFSKHFQRRGCKSSRQKELSFAQRRRVQNGFLFCFSLRLRVSARVGFGCGRRPRCAGRGWRCHPPASEECYPVLNHAFFGGSRQVVTHVETDGYERPPRPVGGFSVRGQDRGIDLSSWFLSGTCRQSFFFVTEVLTFIGCLGKISNIGGLSG